eukprot:TRINITY_DN8262_c0_g1_i2.p1 TRINITY_DN8262_c0_g1~~TRINITY_DN8262_c0_g1_i2.p1  ORF type:complete len:241 (-),score=21.46 TRINITY_DN8262_c0_g1_i2:163-786(-)
MHWLETNLRGDFCISPSFEPKFMAALFYEGFLTIATPAGRSCLLLPKLHQQRSIIEFKDLHVAHKARKHSKQYELSLDKAFPAAVACCIKQHGQNWLLPPMVDSLTFMHKNRVHPQVSVHSVELWKNGQLVAGEIGYLVGKVFTSMTGFCRLKNAGTIQLVALGKRLQSCGVELWDLGMGMGYKTALTWSNGCAKVRISGKITKTAH